jgi:hypothetical protein
VNGTLIYESVSGASQFFALTTYVAFFFVAMTVVRSRRPDAWFPFGAGAGLLVLEGIVRIVSSFAMKVGLSAYSYKVDTYYMYLSGMVMVTTVLGIIAWVLVLIGLVRIASPPGEPSPNRAPGDY